MGVRRHRIEMLHATLQAIKEGRHLPTHISYKINTNWRQTIKHLNDLLKLGHVMKEGRMYKLTVEGGALLRSLDGIMEQIHIS